MNRKRTFLSAGAFVVLSAALLGVKWKQDHPTPTAQDLLARQHLIDAKESYIAGVGKRGFYHVLSPRERIEIARNLFIITSQKEDAFRNRAAYQLNFGTPKKFSDVLYVSEKYRLDSYVEGSYAREAIIRRDPMHVHPRTSKFIHG